MKKPAVIDFETYYDSVCSLKTIGSWAYTRHSDFDPYLVSVKTPDFEYVGDPKTFDWARLDGHLLLAHNMNFDYAVLQSLKNRWGCQLPKDAEFNCTANMATFFKGGRSLKDAARTLLGKKLSKDVRTAVKAKTWDMMRGLAPVLKNNPDAACFKNLAEQMENYAMEDSRTAYELWDSYAHIWPSQESKLSQLTIESCSRGFYVDTEYVKACVENLEYEIWHAQQRLPWVTGNETKALSKILLDRHCREEGIEPPSTTSEDAYEYQQWEKKWGARCSWVRDMRTVRKANTLLKRFTRLRDEVDDQNIYRYGLKYGGAHTLRWSGDSGFNIHNFPRDAYITTTRQYECDLRKAVLARPGKKFAILDLAQIEARVLAYLAGEQEVLDLVAKGQSIYEVHARKTMGWAGGTLKKEDPERYALAKARVLGLGYGCGAVKFQALAELMFGLELSANLAAQTVKDFRRSNPKIVALWRELDNGLRHSFKDGFYEVELPCGWRSLTYYNITGSERGIKASVDKKSPPLRIWGAKICENLVQAVARDILGEILLALDRAGIPVLFHVHDEIVCELDENDSLDETLKITEATPEWLKGCPIAAEGVESKFYMK